VTLDFIQFITKETKNGIEVRPDFVVGRSTDLMVQGGAFYAIWNEEKKLWSRDEYDVQKLVDAEVKAFAEEYVEKGVEVAPKYLKNFANGGWKQFRAFVKNVSDNSHPLDTRLTFADTKTKKSDYASRRLSYILAPGDISAYDELVSLLYSEEEREKFEWAIGAIICGDAKKIQKFLVFYGKGGTGKSTIMDIVFLLLGGKVSDGGYVAMFDAKSLVGNNGAFATEAFKDNPLVAIQQDGDLSKIEDNSKLNSIISHEDMRVNEKYKATYDTKVNAFLFMGTNKAVKISDAKSGLIRRLIDVNPTGETHSPDRYFTLVDRLKFELGGIAYHCLQVYKTLGRNYYSDYRPENMMLKTNVFYNYIDWYRDIFKAQDGTTLKQAWELYLEYAKEAELEFKTPRHIFGEELKNYFHEFHERRPMPDGSHPRKVYVGFKNPNPFKAPVDKAHKIFTLVLEETESLLDEMYAGLPAQYTSKAGTPKSKWESVKTTLGDIDTQQLHYLKVPENHIVIDFDLKDENGEKSLEANLIEASKFPQTYAEVSKSGNGVHLHYIYDGDVSDLARVYSDNIEIKVYTGNSSLRRQLTWCNNVAVATINGGLPFKENKSMPASKSMMQTEQGIRALIAKNLRKGVHPGTKPSMEFIEHILKEANKNGVIYDVSDMFQKMFAFCNNSKKNSEYCMTILERLQLKSEKSFDEIEEAEKPYESVAEAEKQIVFFDCEVYPNLFVVCWKYLGTPNSSVVSMINPTPAEIEQFIYSNKLIGFNNRSYDNHILWARFLGCDNEALYELSQRIITKKDQNAKFGQAYSISYADVYDYSSTKMGLKKWEIFLGIPHVEMDIPWDKPVPEKLWTKVVNYCINDVNALEAVFNYCKQDLVAREILASMSGLSVNNPTRQHAIKIIFGDDRTPQSKFVYTDLSEMFPGYKFDPYSKNEKSTYRGEVAGEGGYVYAEPGIHKNVALLDVASMHPTSIEELNLFGPYTTKFSALKNARLALKNGEYESIKDILPWEIEGVKSDADASALSDALKLVINSVYGYTSAKFENPFRDPRNIDNIVAKRGALFMIDLKHAIQEQGFTVAHIKTDSVKIPNATPDIIAFVQEFGAKYGYTFEHEATYEKMCLVNDAVYVAYEKESVKKGKTVPAHWTATGAEFKHPYVFKTLFTKEPISWADLGETKMVKEGAMYLRYPEGQMEVGQEEVTENGDIHIGRSGLFIPVNPMQSDIVGGQLLRIKDGREYAVTGTKGYKWVEEDTVRQRYGDAIDRLTFERFDQSEVGTGGIRDIVDEMYYNQLAENAAQSIMEFGDFDEFVTV
jgi:hypothetical protein